MKMEVFKLMNAIFLFIALSFSANSQTTGTFTDSRDGKTYKTVKIGQQIWMAENLAYKDNGGGCWAYNNNVNNVKKYGYLYLWEVAAEDKVCPSGWHLPSDKEWKKLIDYLGGEDNAPIKLSSKNFWIDKNINATNSSGFTAIPSGGRDFRKGEFLGIGESCGWWSSTIYDINNYGEVSSAIALDFSYDHNEWDTNIEQYKAENALSVRCIKD